MKSAQPSILIAGPVNVRASLEQALASYEVRVHGCSFPDLIATCAGTSPSVVVLAGTMKGVELGMAATALADHVATRSIPVAILTAEPGVPPARRADAAPLTLVLSHQGIASVAERLVELARTALGPRGRAGAVAEQAGASKSGGEPQLDDRLDPFLNGEPTEDTGSGPIRALHLQASIASEPSTNVTRSRDWTWEDSPQGTALTDDNDDQKAAKQRRLARTMMGVAPSAPGAGSGQGPTQGPGLSGDADGDMPAPAASRAGAWGAPAAKSDSVMPTGFPPARPKPLARAALRKAEPSTVGPLPTDEEQAPVISPIVGPPRSAGKPRPKTMLGVGLPLPGAVAAAPADAQPAAPAPAAAQPAASAVAPAAAPATAAATPATPAADVKKVRPRTMLGLGLGAPGAEPASAVSPAAPAAAAKPASSISSSSLPAVQGGAAKPASSISSSSLPAVQGGAAKPASSTSSSSLPAVQGTAPARSPKFTPAAPMAAVTSPKTPAAPLARPTAAATVAKPTPAVAPAPAPAAAAKPAATAAAVPAAAPAASAPATPAATAAASPATAPRSGAPGPRRSANRTIMGGMGSPLSPPPPVNLPSHRPDDTAVVPTESERPAAITASGNFSAPTGPAAAQFGGAASMDFTDEPTVVGDSVKRAAVKDDGEAAPAASSTQLAGADEDGFDDFDDLGLGLDQDEATQILDQSSIAAAKLEALRAKSAQPDETEFDTLRPPPAPATPPANPARQVEDDFEVAATEPPPPGVGIDGIVSEGTLSLTDALELDFMEPDRLGRTMEFDDQPITGGAANANPQTAAAPVRPKGYQQSQSGTEEDTEIVAGLTKQLDQQPAKAAGRKSRTWLWATLAIFLVGGVAVGGWYAAPSVWGTSAHSDDTVAYTPVPSHETPPAGDPTAPTPTPPDPTVAVAPPAPPTPTPTPVPPAPDVVAEAPPVPTPVPPPTPPTPVPPTPVVAPPAPTPPPAAAATGDEARLRQALAADAENYEAMASLAEVLIARGNHDEALTLAQAAVRGRARVGRYHMIYGDARAAAGDRSGASRSWSRAVETDPSLAAEVTRRRSAN